MTELLAALEERPDVDLGLLTGNWPETGGRKIAAAGIEPVRFAACAWGSDAPTRPELLAVALARLAERTGRRATAREVVVVGDTPADVLVAKTGGARSLAVATGTVPAEALAEAGADLVVATLADTAAVLAWLDGG